jgi:hypothetical protein
LDGCLLILYFPSMLVSKNHLHPPLISLKQIHPTHAMCDIQVFHKTD